MFDKTTVIAVERIAARLKIEPAALLAVVEIESAGRVFATVNGRQEPLIRFEGHYFYRRLDGAKRKEAQRLGLADARAGHVRNPNSQVARWKMLGKASAIDKVAAFESTSWGVGQVMGAHWTWLGYETPGAMLKEVRSGIAGQIEVMVRYIERAGLVDELQRRDFTAFARGYNGPAYGKHGYHTKMAAAYRRWSDGKAPVSAAQGMLRMGSKGARVREIQALLIRAGFSLEVDGDFGPATKDAVMAFQADRKIEVDGVVGPQTQRALAALKIDPAEPIAEKGLLETDEAKAGGGAVIGAAGLETARQAVETAVDRVAYVPGLETISAILTVASVALVIGGIAWTAYGWWKARQTDEGDVVAAPAAPAPYAGDIMDLA